MKRVLKWIGIVIGVLIVLIAVAIGGIFWRSNMVMNRVYAAPDVSITIPTDDAAIARGKHLVSAVSVCVSCHGPNFGGGPVMDDPAIGHIVALNLTRGKNGVGSQLSDGDIARVVRFGVLPNGKSVRIMPSDDYHHLSDADLGAIIAYIRSLPPVDSDLPPSGSVRSDGS